MNYKTNKHAGKPTFSYSIWRAAPEEDTDSTPNIHVDAHSHL